MEEKMAREMLPAWAGDDDFMKEYIPKTKKSKTVESRPRRYSHELKVTLADAANDFIRRNLIAILVITAFLLEGWIVAAYTRSKVSHDVRQTAEEEKQSAVKSAATTERNYIFYVLDITPEQFAAKEETKADGQKTEEEILLEEIKAMAVPVAEHIAGLRMDRDVTVAGAKTYVWGVDFARLKSGKYGETIEDVLEGNIEGYTKGHAVRPEDSALAFDLCKEYKTGKLPSKWTPDLEFAEINADGSVTARNELNTNSKTKYWWWEE